MFLSVVACQMNTERLQIKCNGVITLWVLSKPIAYLRFHFNRADKCMYSYSESNRTKVITKNYLEITIYHIFMFSLVKPTGHVMHQQFNIQQLYALPTLYLCVLYLSENKQRLVPLTV